MEIRCDLHSLGESPVCPAGRNNWWASMEMGIVDFYKDLDMKLLLCE